MINAGPGQFSPDTEDATSSDTDAWHNSHSEMVGDRMSGRAARLAGVVHWCGALASVGLLIGFAVWGVKLSLRDVTQVPVVLALEKPMRVAPSNPGGADIAHKGLSVNEVQEARGTPEAPMEVRVLDEPTQLHSEDMTVAAEVAPLTEEERAAQTWRWSSVWSAGPLACRTPCPRSKPYRAILSKRNWLSCQPPPWRHRP